MGKELQEGKRKLGTIDMYFNLIVIWFHAHIQVSRLIKWYALNVFSLSYVDDVLIRIYTHVTRELWGEE